MTYRRSPRYCSPLRSELDAGEAPRLVRNLPHAGLRQSAALLRQKLNRESPCAAPKQLSLSLIDQHRAAISQPINPALT